MVKVTNWGLYPLVQSNFIQPRSVGEIQDIMRNSRRLIARGNGRSYGDSSLQNNIVSMLSFDKILFFNKQDSVIHTEAGVTLDQLLNFIVPKGYFLPVTPGTKFITIGGAIAANVHGKNHHNDGSIGTYVKSITLLNAEGEIVRCSSKENFQVFKETIGGMGHTGIILSAEIELIPVESSYISTKVIKARNLYELLDLAQIYKDEKYSVSWIDCLSSGKSFGRGLLLLGRHTELAALNGSQRYNPLKIHSAPKIKIPFYPPSGLINRYSMRLFNALYFNKQLNKQIGSQVHYDKFFYPLDSIMDWNKLYGKNGFTQYQFVIPFETGIDALIYLLRYINNYKDGAYLAVLKSFGEEKKPCSSLSFPMPGYTLAVDFKISKDIFRFLKELDQRVIAYGGRIYLAKDMRLDSSSFAKMYPEAYFRPDKFASIQSERIFDL
jgi:FAD/FMN-containing dehydrogenase